MAELKPSAVTAPAPVRPVIGQGTPRGVIEARAEPIPGRKACQQGACPSEEGPALYSAASVK
jgi:hypothetical protein